MLLLREKTAVSHSTDNMIGIIWLSFYSTCRARYLLWIATSNGMWLIYLRGICARLHVLSTRARLRNGIRRCWQQLSALRNVSVQCCRAELTVNQEKSTHICSAVGMNQVIDAIYYFSSTVSAEEKTFGTQTIFNNLMDNLVKVLWVICKIIVTIYFFFLMIWWRTRLCARTWDSIPVWCRFCCSYR